MTEYEQEIVEKMEFLGKSGKSLLDKYPHLRKKTQRQVIRHLSHLTMNEKLDQDFLRNFETQYPASKK